MTGYRIGIIGLGARAETFVRQLATGTRRTMLHSVCDIDADRMEKFCAYCGVRGVPRFSDPVAFFDQPSLDAVMIMTPDFTHLDVVRQAVAARKPFYLEKPMEVTLERCRELVRIARRSGLPTYMGFNMRVSRGYRELKQIVLSQTLGQLVHIEGLEQLRSAHGAAFMRRFHRYRARSGGLINTKSSHDADMMQWLVGRGVRLSRVSAFGGTRVFCPGKAPAARCGECPEAIAASCRYRDQSGFVFPIGGERPLHKIDDVATYGGDLCVYTADKDIADSMTVICEWENGVSGNFNLQMFQAEGRREWHLWGENGRLDFDDGQRIVVKESGGKVHETAVADAPGGHGGADPKMLDLFVSALDGEPHESTLEDGLAAAILALSAEQAMLERRVIEIPRELYEV